MPDPMTEIFDADFERLDLVKGGANGAFFLLAKSEKPTPRDVAERLAKAEKSTADINDLPDTDFAYIESGGKKDDSGKTTPRSLRHFPIMDAAHVRNSLSRAPQSPFGDKAMPKIHAAAKKFGIDSDNVKKAQDTMADDDAATMTPDEALDAADDDAAGAPVPTETPGDPNDPGSPAWEAVDAARARSAVNSLVSLKALVADLADRETTEAVGGDGPADDNAWDLAGVIEALDCALACLAKFAVDEQAEADEGVQEIEETARALGLIKSVTGAAGDLVARITKAGRVLSAANEQALREAAAAIDKVLASLPAAQPEESNVTKSETLPAAADTEAVKKAKGDPQVAVYDAKGNLVGTIDAADLNPIQAATPPDGGDKDTPATEPAADSNDDNTAVTIPGTGTVQSPPQTDDDSTGDGTAVAKATPSHEEAPASKLDEIAEMVKSLKERVEKVEATPMPGGPLLNGATGTSGVASRDPNAKPDEVAELRKAAETATDPKKAQELSYAAAFAAIRKRQATPAAATVSADPAEVLARFTRR